MNVCINTLLLYNYFRICSLLYTWAYGEVSRIFKKSIALYSDVQCSQVQDSAMHAIIIILGYIQISNTRNTIEQNNRYELLYNALWKDVRFSYRETHTHRESERRLARALYSIINIYYFCPGKHFCSFCRISCQMPRSIPHTKFNNEINWTECAKAYRTHRAAVWNKQMRMRKFNKKKGDCKSRTRSVTTILFTFYFTTRRQITNSYCLFLLQLFALHMSNEQYLQKPTRKCTSEYKSTEFFISDR